MDIPRKWIALVQGCAFLALVPDGNGVHNSDY